MVRRSGRCSRPDGLRVPPGTQDGTRGDTACWGGQLGLSRELMTGACGAREPFTGAGAGGELAVGEDEMAAAQDERRPALDLPPVVDRVAGQRLHARAVDRAVVPWVPERDVGVGADGD